MGFSDGTNRVWRAVFGCALLACTMSACGDSGNDTLANDQAASADGKGGGANGNGASNGNGAGSDNAAGAGAGEGTGANGAMPTPIVRRTDYGEALRSASLKLVGELPTLAEIKAIAAAATDADKKPVYEATVDTYLADPRFAAQQIAWWRNTFKTGVDQGVAPAQGMPNLDTAATFAASVVVQDRPYTDLLTATTGTCATFANGTFTAANCTTNAKIAGVLTDPGLMAQFTSNMAFRRVRFVQETFDCARFPAELKPEGTPMGAGTYTSPWPFESITGGAGAKINFQDTSAVICANCHTTMNHIAPLFANFDAKGAFQNTIQVQTPVTPPATTVLGDWLPAGQTLAWRNGVTVTDLPSLGTAMAQDPAIAACGVVRVWNWALSRGDVVNDGASVPSTVVAEQVAAFTAGGMKMKAAIRSVFTSADFVQF